jgi:hypothetical protein
MQVQNLHTQQFGSVFMIFIALCSVQLINSHAHITRFRQELQVHQSDSSYTIYTHMTAGYTTSSSTLISLQTQLVLEQFTQFIHT